MTKNRIVVLSLLSTFLNSALVGTTFAQEKSESRDKLDLLYEKLKNSKDVAEEYVRELGGQDFISAKKSFYDNIPYSIRKQRFVDVPNIKEWKSLNHPPIKQLDKELTFYDEAFSPINYKEIQSPYFSSSFHKDSDNISKSDLTFGNKLKLLTNGDAYEVKLNLIRNATSSISIANMSFFCDESSDVIADELIKKVKEDKVEVRLIVEKVWTQLVMKKCLRKLKKGGVKVRLANDLLKRGDKQSLFHNKFWVFDDEIAIVGGMNIINSDNLSTGFNDKNRDTDLLIEGPIATDVQHSFISLWKKYEKKNSKPDPTLAELEYRNQNRRVSELENGTRGEKYYDQILSNPETRMKGVCRFVRQGPDIGKDLISNIYARYIKEAQSSIYLISQKIRFPAEFEKKNKPANADIYWEEVFKAADRNTKVTVISNGIDGRNGEVTHVLSDIVERKRSRNRPGANLISLINNSQNKSVAKWNFPYMMHINQYPNMEAWTFFQFIHSKIIYLDRIITSVGSFNLESYSSDHSHESTVICQDEDLSAVMDYQTVLDKVNSTPTPKEDKLKK